MYNPVMKKILIIILTAAANIAVFFLLFPQFGQIGKEPVCIAVAGPMSDPRGQQMLQGISLYTDLINRQGGIGGRKIKLTVYDDKDDPKTAEAVADSIVQQNNAVLVLGHYRTGASVAAGKIYRKNEIPVITASATAEAVTAGNEWYFRVIPTDTAEADFAASYICRGMKKNAACIIFSDDDYGMTLVKNFERAADSLGMKIKQKWKWEREKDTDERAKQIAGELLSGTGADDEGILFLAVHSKEGAKIISALKDAGGMKCPIIGSYAFARSFFIELEKYPRESDSSQGKPGYYSEGIYFITPFMADIGGAEAYRFKKEFRKKYDAIPEEISASYYEAAHVAAEALKKASILGEKQIRENRRRIRDTLSGFYSEAAGVRGITGPVFFDENRNVRRHYSVGQWQNHKAVPAFLQYQQTDTVDEDILKKVLDGEILLVNGIAMNDIRLVSAGIDNIRLTSTDIKHSAAGLEFDLRLSYSGYFDDTGIEFDNAVKAIQLGKPVKEEKQGSITRRTWHVIGDFIYDSDFRTWPLGSLSAAIRFRHSRQTNDRLIFVPDSVTTPASGGISAGGWETGDTEFYQDAVYENAGAGNFSGLRLSYSRFNAEIQIKQVSPVLSAATEFFPVIAMLLLTAAAYFFIRHERLRMAVFMGVLAGATFFHLRHFAALPAAYMTLLNYSFFAVYVTVLFAVFRDVRAGVIGHGKL
ncbi:MAG: hypothetical protein BWK80_26130 [Desulfobacteraceae bacterium IS3]|nr:MAG: hypothetical protein BWK80_26130 [Desulfobacteraceae bacterium IS3]